MDSSVISPDFIRTVQLFSMLYEMGYTDVLTTITMVKKSCLPSQWNGLLTLLIKSLAERSAGSDGTSKGFLTILYGLYNGLHLDYGSIIWSQVVQSSILQLVIRKFHAEGSGPLSQRGLLIL